MSAGRIREYFPGTYVPTEKCRGWVHLQSWLGNNLVILIPIPRNLVVNAVPGGRL